MADDTKNEKADKFLEGLNGDETIIEKKGRHYAEGEARFATVAALAELAQMTTRLASAQTTMSGTVTELTKRFTEASEDVTTLKVWMEGTMSPNGTRVLGVLDHISTFKRWKNLVIALLTGILIAQVTGNVLGFLNHAAVTAHAP